MVSSLFYTLSMLIIEEFCKDFVLYFKDTEQRGSIGTMSHITKSIN